MNKATHPLLNEQLMQLGQFGSLAGVLTLGQHKRVCVLMLNAGLLHHIGPAGLYVQLARALQQQGIASCRFDLSALGDSPPRPDHLPIFQTIVQEPQEVIHDLSVLGYERFILLGICSGAYSAFHTSVRDARVIGVVMINPEDLALGQQIEGQSRQTEATGAQQAWASRYWRQSLFRPKAWLNLVTGQVNYQRLWQTLGRQLQRLWQDKAQRQVADPALIWVQQHLSELLARRVQVLCVTSQADVAVYYVQRLLAPWTQQANPQQMRLPNTDHLFTHLAGRKHLLENLVGWIEQQVN